MRDFDFAHTKEASKEATPQLVSSMPRGDWATRVLYLLLFVLVVIVYPLSIYSQPPLPILVTKAHTYDIPTIFRDVSKLVTLPVGEVPQLAQITDLAPLQHQSFFRRVLIDDVLILYPKHNLKILFDPVGGKIINMSQS